MKKFDNYKLYEKLKNQIPTNLNLTRRKYV